MRVLVTGAAGQVGRALAAAAPQDIQAHFLDRQDLDVGDAEQVRACVSALQPDVIINAAAYTAVDKAESDEASALRANAAAPLNLARTGVRLIQISTDFVFSGNASTPYQPSDPAAPLGVYGRSKLAGENAVLDALGAKALVVRTAWVYEAYGHNFLQTMLRLFRERGQVGVVDDQIGTPTAARSLAEVLWLFAKRPDLSGVYHWTDAGVASWYDFAVAIAEEVAARNLIGREVTVSPITTRDYPTPAKRPAYSVLDKRLTLQALGLRPRHWRGVLRSVMEDLVRA